MDENHPPSTTSVGYLSTFIHSDGGLAIGHFSSRQCVRQVPARPVGICGVRGVGTPDRVSTRNQIPAYRNQQFGCFDTLSRIALIEILALSILCGFFRKRCGISKVWVGLPLWQACVHFAAVVFQEVKPGSEISIYNRFTESNQTRFDIYNGVAHIIQDNPVWGIGWRQFQWVQMSYPELDGALDHAHNLLLQIQLELGLAGTVGLLAFVLYWFKQKPWSSSRPAAVVGLMVAAMFGLHSMTEYPLWYAPSLFAFSIAVAFMGR
ncbi:MAG: hypothetical protein EBW49_02705 [Betaproteobacteria bacterium]|nr:hypothetical protein [Betaproteobacteria bacterium]